MKQQPGSPRKKISFRTANRLAAILLISIASSPIGTASSNDGLPGAIGAASPRQVAYFQFDYPPNPQTFIFSLTDPEKIQEARDILSGVQPNRHIMGTIVKQPAAYNPPWHYSLDPATVTFFTSATEVCDATIQYVEDHLNDVCNSFLPRCMWCPWGSRLLAEVNPLPTVTPPSPQEFIYLPIIVK